MTIVAGLELLHPNIMPHSHISDKLMMMWTESMTTTLYADDVTELRMYFDKVARAYTFA